jgi:hypothetical protein
MSMYYICRFILYTCIGIIPVGIILVFAVTIGGTEMFNDWLFLSLVFGYCPLIGSLIVNYKKGEGPRITN